MRKWLAAHIGPQEVLLTLGLALVAAGCWISWKPGAFLAPGVALVWIALPSRTSFVWSSKEKA